MSTRVDLKWKGDKVLSKVQRATLDGINVTMGQAVKLAKRNHKWVNRTGTLEGSIAIATYARRHGKGARGLWGSKDVVYALIQELGGRGIKARPYLVPAAKAKYPFLGAHIRRFMQ